MKVSLRYYLVHLSLSEKLVGSLDICRKIRDKWMKMMSVVFNEYRTIRTNKYALSVLLNDRRGTSFCYENGIPFFLYWLCGWFDMMAAHTILLEQRKQYPDMTAAVVPYVGQDVYFNKPGDAEGIDILLSRQGSSIRILLCSMLAPTVMIFSHDFTRL